MTARSSADDRLDSWKDIASYLGRNVRTVIRWEKDRGLPIHRVPGGQRHAVYAWRHEIDAWLRRGHNEASGNADAPETILRTSGLPELKAEDPAAVSSAYQLASSNLKSPLRHWTLWATAGLLVLGSCSYAIRSLAFRTEFRFISVVQLTDDGHQKEGLVSDGTNLYFNESEAGRRILAYVPVSGGAVRKIPTPLNFIKVLPFDISPDRKELLLSGYEGKELEGSLWVLPLVGGPLRRVGSIYCHSAAWSPNSRTIAFADRNRIYLTTSEGASTKAVQEFEGSPSLLRWSPDGRRLRFFLKAQNEDESSFWQVTFDSGSRNEVESIEPLHVSVHEPQSFLFDSGDRSFVTHASGIGSEILLIRPGKGIWRHQLVIAPMEPRISGPYGLVDDPHSNRLFTLGNSGVANRNRPRSDVELLKFDLNTHQFGPFLPGVSAKDVDFSRDGRSIAYVTEPDHELWIANADGRNRRKIPFDVVDMELPRWSPDGRFVAFMARNDGKPWRIFIATIATGRVTEASIGDDNQGAPTWSPDGRSIAYGNVKCMETTNCAIHKIDIASRRQTMIPGSDGLGSARWSPDGRFIAALASERPQVMIFDVARREWRHLLDNVNGSDLAWSRDSRFLYASRNLNQFPEILRVEPSGGHEERVADLREFAALNGETELWFAVAPDGTFVLARAMAPNEIFSLSYTGD